MIFVGTAGTDTFTGGAGNDIFEFSAATLANADTVEGGGGSDRVLTTRRHGIGGQGRRGQDLRARQWRGRRPDPGERQFHRGRRASITVYGGNAGNTVDASGLTGANRVIFVGTAGTDNFTGGAGNDIFEFSAATLANADTVKGGAGTNELLMTTAGTFLAGGTSRVETYELGNGGADSLTTGEERQFRQATANSITIAGGNAGNTVDASGLTGVQPGGRDRRRRDRHFHRRGRQRLVLFLGREPRQCRHRQAAAPAQTTWT